jgi:hypothetical protein
MKHLAQTEHNLHLYWLIVVQLGHPITADFCSSGKIAFFHLILPYKVPELIVTDCHEHPSCSENIAGVALVTWIYRQILLLQQDTIQHFRLYHKNPHIFKMNSWPSHDVDGFKHQDKPFSSFHYLASNAYS